MRTAFILTGKTGAAFRELAGTYAAAYPGRFLMFAGFSDDGIDDPDYGERLPARPARRRGRGCPWSSVS